MGFGAACASLWPMDAGHAKEVSALRFAAARFGPSTSLRAGDRALPSPRRRGSSQ
jgi:hypothetical protein